MNQLLILVNKEDKFLGYATREECHIGRGKHHRAFVSALFDSQNQIYLQKRKHRLFDGLWDLTAISHPLKINGQIESYQEASDRALKKEMGIGHVAIKKIGGFNYVAFDGGNCENEYCAVLVGTYQGRIHHNKNEVYEVNKMPSKRFLQEVGQNPAFFTPWAAKACKILKRELKDRI